MTSNIMILFVTYILMAKVLCMLPEDDETIGSQNKNNCGVLGSTDQPHCTEPTENMDDGIYTDEPDKPCSAKMPCAWETYDKFTRKFYSFTKNKCYCVGDKKCLKDRDEVSIHSYVYLCK